MTIKYDGVEVENFEHAYSGFYNFLFDVPSGPTSGKFTLDINGYITTYEQEVIVPPGGSWQQTATIEEYVVYGTQFQIGKNFYFGVGYYPDNGGILQFSTSSFYKFDCETEQWSSLEEFPFLTDGQAPVGNFSFVIGDRGYTGGGSIIDGGKQYSLYEYDPSTDSWSINATDIPADAVNPTNSFGFSANGKGYVINPENGNVFEFNPVSDEWSLASSIPGTLPVTLLEDFVIDNIEYVALRRSDSAPIEFWKFDPQTGTWAQKSYPGLLSTNGTFAFVVEGKGYIGSMDHFWEYDPVLESWARRKPYPSYGFYRLPGFSYGKKGFSGLAGSRSYPGPGDPPNTNELYSFEVD